MRKELSVALDRLNRDALVVDRKIGALRKNAIDLSEEIGETRHKIEKFEFAPDRRVSGIRLARRLEECSADLVKVSDDLFLLEERFDKDS